MSPSSANNLPRVASSLLGRSAQLAELARLLETARLVTLTGAPGIGKSRLALELSRSVADERPGGVWLVELAPVRGDAGVTATVAAALSVVETAGESHHDTLLKRLRGRRAVLVLDNCEHVRAGCATLACALLASGDDLTIVATSRSPLGIDGEHVVRVAPLEVPTGHVVSRDELTGYAAVELFVERARRVAPGFELNAYVAPAVAEICRRLDGVPLAIELAAARVEVLTPGEIAERLDDRFALLSKGDAEVPPDRRTLTAALDCSHELLDEPERILLRRLSVFAGSFDAAAANEVCGSDGAAPEAVATALAALVTKSLVTEDSERAAGVRFRLLETTRAYAAERLDDALEVADLRAAHARWILGLAEDAEPHLTGPEQQRWLERLAAVRADLHAALDWSISNGRREWSLRIGGALVLYWRVHGHFSEGRDLLEAAISNETGDPCEVKALWGAGFLRHMAGDSDGAIVLLERSLLRAHERDDPVAGARTLLVLGNAWQERDADRALRLLRDSAALARASGDRWCLAHALGLAGFGHIHRDELTVARALLEECLAVARGSGDTQSRRLGLLGLGSVALLQWDLAVAEPLLTETIALADELGEDYTKAVAMEQLGQVARARGEPERARRLFDDAITLMSAARPGQLAGALVLRARLAIADGDREYASRLLVEAEAVARKEGESAGPALQALGEIKAGRGEPISAQRLFEEALELARAHMDRRGAAAALQHLAGLASDAKRAQALYVQALECSHEAEDVVAIGALLDLLAALEADEGRAVRAAQLRGAAAAARGAGHARQAPTELDEEAAAAWTRGAASSIDAVIAFAADSPDGVLADWSSLTDREREVAVLAGEGLTNREIAARLVVSHWTVKTHVANVFAKLGVTRRSELVRELSRGSESTN